MLLNMPIIDPSIPVDLEKVQAVYAEACRNLADAEFHAAASVIRSAWGEDASRLLVDKEINEDGNTVITLLALMDHDNELMWFNHEFAADYPGAEDISNDFGRPLTEMASEITDYVTNHIEAGYDAAGGCFGALDSEYDEHFDPDTNLLVLDI